ncbi:MAG: hypothetical protein MI866_12950, partial [Bacteroidales bacterium]|nr:hypothetical protein [Bacteroidales bacterium]
KVDANILTIEAKEKAIHDSKAHIDDVNEDMANGVLNKTRYQERIDNEKLILNEYEVQLAVYEALVIEAKADLDAEVDAFNAVNED